MSILDYYKYAQLATAAYVRLGSGSWDGARFATLAASAEQTRLPLSIAQYLFDPDNDYDAPVWTIRHYYGGDNPATPDTAGFAATLFQQGAEKVLALRGTEPFEDGAVDLLSADIGQIGILGIALSQTVSMINLIQRMRGGFGQSVSQIQLAVSHIAPPQGVRYVEAQGMLGSTVYLEFRRSEATGLDLIAPGGKITVTGHSLSGELAVLAAMLFPESVNAEVPIFNAAGINPGTADLTSLASGLLGPISTGGIAAIAGALAADLGLSAASLSQTGQQLAGPLMETMLETLYGLPRDWDWGARFEFSQPGNALSDLNIHNLRSEDLVPGNDFNAIPSVLTGADHYPGAIDIATEANSHVIEPFMDALALHALLYRLNDELTLADHEKLLLAASPELNRSEEALTEALFKLFLPDGEYLSGRQGGNNAPVYAAEHFDTSDATTGLGAWVGKGDINARDAFHDAVLRIEQAVQGRGYQLLSLADASAQALRAFTLSPDGIAFRYALKALNPFAVTGVDYSIHNANGELELYGPENRTGSLTVKWIEDRAAMLAAKMQAFTADTDVLAGEENRQYIDLASGTRIYQSNASDANGLPVPVISAPRFVFGGDHADVLEGDTQADRLYGLDGADTILDTDGRGVLRYTYNAGIGPLSDITDTVIADASIKLSDNEWESADGRFTYTREGADLRVTINDAGAAGGSLLLKDWQQGDFAIRLAEEERAAIRTPRATSRMNCARVAWGLTYDEQERMAA